MTWYQKSFGDDYLLVYKHRDMQGAYEEVQQMAGWLHLPQGARVLDLCCGMGRHSLALSDFGYSVTGVDLSEVLLGEADRLDLEGKVRRLRGDMRSVPLDETFDAVVNLFTSFGYFDDDAENERVLEEMHRLLRPGGAFLIDYLNPEYVRHHLVPFSERIEDGVTIQETRRIEEGCVRKRIVLLGEGEPEREYLEQVKLYDLSAFEGMLLQAGLSVDAVYGGYDGSAYSAEGSARMIFVGHREE